MKGFASDNYAAVHPDVMAALADANDGHAVSYGADPWTARADALLREHFGAAATPYLVFNGSGANVLCLRALCRPWEAVICTAGAHVNTDEGGGPEIVAGLKMLTCPSPDGKLSPEGIAAWLPSMGNVHAAQPRVVTVTQSTELGTRYEVDELKAIGEFCAANGLLLHIDGARLANAAAALDVGLGDLAGGVGASAVSFGGTKNGLMLGEAAVFLDPRLAPPAAFVRKQLLQLASKHRFLAAQFVALLSDDLWRRLAGHANEMAARLAGAVGGIDGVRITQSVQANGIFAVLPPGVAARLQVDWPFYTWNEATGEVRWMCSWDTTRAEVDAFAAAIASACTT